MSKACEIFSLDEVGKDGKVDLTGAEGVFPKVRVKGRELGPVLFLLLVEPCSPSARPQTFEIVGWRQRDLGDSGWVIGR